MSHLYPKFLLATLLIIDWLGLASKIEKDWVLASNLTEFSQHCDFKIM